jgi:hypothetical protein
MGREIESHQSIHRVGALKNDIQHFDDIVCSQVTSQPDFEYFSFEIQKMKRSRVSSFKVSCIVQKNLNLIFLKKENDSSGV